MPDAALPFRPRTLTPVDRALASIETQTSSGRRRLNRVSLQHALFVAAGTVLLGFSALVALAFRLSAAGFAGATWAILACSVIVTLTSARGFRRAWVPSMRAAVVIDHRAGLEDRLATLAAARAGERRSRLWTFLLHENLRLLPTWEPRHLVPRLTPRSVWFFALSVVLAALAATRIPLSGPPARSAVHGDARAQPPPPVAEDSSESETVDGFGSSSTFWRDLPQSLQRAIVGSTSSQMFPGRIPDRTAPLENDRGGPAIVGRQMKNGGSPRSMPASPEAMNLAGPAKEGRGALPAPNPNRPNESQDQTNARPARGDRPKALAAEAGPLRHQQSKPKQEQAKGLSGGGGGSGAGGGSDKDGLFGERQAPGNALGSFALDLDAPRGNHPDKDGEDSEPVARPSVVLSTDPRLDDAVRRAQVPSEYEKIVQRIFNRTADAVDQP